MFRIELVLFPYPVADILYHSKSHLDHVPHKKKLRKPQNFFMLKTMIVLYVIFNLTMKTYNYMQNDSPFDEKQAKNTILLISLAEAK